MAFFEADKITIAEIIGLSLQDTDALLIRNGAIINYEIETAVGSLLTEYRDLPPDDGLEIFPNTANKGVRLRNARTVAEERIKNALVKWLSVSQSSQSTIALHRV